MKRNLHGMLFILLAIVFVGSGGLAARQLYYYHAAEQSYQAASSMAAPQVEFPDDLVWEPVLPPLSQSPELSLPQEEVLPPDETAQALMAADLDALRQVNSVVLGWIHIPDSPIDYPLLQVTDNQEYLRRAWDGTPNNVGCIFLECTNSTDFSDLHTLIYGHYMRNGTMFGSLHNYKDQEYWDTHPYIYITTDEGVRRYRVFSTYEADLVSDTYRLFSQADQRWQTALDYYASSSVMESSLSPSVEDCVLTLSTCTGTGTYHSRWVVQAVLDREFPREA